MEEDAPPPAPAVVANAPPNAAQAGAKRKKVLEDPLKPNGVQWIEREKGAIDVDVSKLPSIPKHKTILRWHSIVSETCFGKIKTPLQYFQQSYPMKTLRGTIDSTLLNMESDRERLQAMKSSKPLYPFNKERYFKFLGITLSMALNPLRGGIDAYFSKNNSTSGEFVLELGGNYAEKYGMGLHEYKNIRQYFQLSLYTAADLLKNQWLCIDPFADAFNENRVNTVAPGRGICVDELMSSWEGLEGKYIIGGMPHVTKIARKPKGVGAELKCAADIQTGIMLPSNYVQTKAIIATCGRTIAGIPHEVERFKIVYYPDGTPRNVKSVKSTAAPEVVNDIFEGFNVIDVHDHYRQGILRLEEHWLTETWWHRLFATLLGVIVTDAYFMRRQANELSTFSTFIGERYPLYEDNHESMITRQHFKSEGGEEEVKKASSDIMAEQPNEAHLSGDIVEALGLFEEMDHVRNTADNVGRQHGGGYL
eukprot:gene26833-32426_t